MSHKKPVKLSRNLTTRKPPIYKKFILICLMIVIGFFLLVLILTPLRTWGAKKYLAGGDEKLLALHYIDAEVEYQKAGILTPLDPEIKSRILLIESAEKDIGQLKTFFQEKDDRGALNDFSAVDQLNDPELLVTLARSFLDRNQPQMAILAAKKAVDRKPGYRDGLQYLAIAYDRAATSTQIRQDSYDYLVEKSRYYLNLAHLSDPAYYTDWNNTENTR